MRLIAPSLMLSLVLGLAACDMGHLGNPAAWPVAAVGGGIENVGYAARRKRVADHVATQHAALLTDIGTGGGPTLSLGADLAGVPAARRPELRRTLKNDLTKFSPDTPAARERLVIWLMVHGS